MFTIHVISLKDKDALEHLNKIKSKIKNKETSNDEDSSNNEEILSNRLTSNTSNNKDGLKNAESLKNGESSKEAKILNNEDAVTLVSIIFMKSDLTESELLFEVAKLVNKAEFELDFIKNQVKAILLILGNKFIEKENEDEFKRFKEIVTVGSSYFASVFERVGEGIRQEVMEEAKAEAKEEYMNGVDKGRLIGLDQGIGIGELKGREEGDESRAISVANWMLNKGMSIKDISEATELSVEKINSLKEEMQDNDGE